MSAAGPAVGPETGPAADAGPSVEGTVGTEGVGAVTVGGSTGDSVGVATGAGVGETVGVATGVGVGETVGGETGEGLVAVGEAEGAGVATGVGDGAWEIKVATKRERMKKIWVLENEICEI